MQSLGQTAGVSPTPLPEDARIVLSFYLFSVVTLFSSRAHNCTSINIYYILYKIV